MNKKDILELKRRLKKETCTFTRMCGCYVDADHNKITKIAETFLNLEDEEYFKYLDIAKKVLSGTIGNNILELQFPLAEEATGGRQQFLMGLRESKLKNDELMDAFYDMVIANYDYVGNYLILIFHDAYDVITKTSDNEKLDESEEVFEYLLCAICPVTLTKPGLGYLEDDNRIGPRVRDWVVGEPDTGFMFPAFTDRSTDIHAAMFYTKDTKHPHAELMESGLGCGERMTGAEKKIIFDNLVEDYFGDEEEKYAEIQLEMNNRVEEKAMTNPDEEAPEIKIEPEDIKTMFCNAGLGEIAAEKAKDQFEQSFKDDMPEAQQLIDNKAIKESLQRKKIEELKLLLIEAVQELKNNGNVDLVKRIEREIEMIVEIGE